MLYKNTFLLKFLYSKRNQKTTDTFTFEKIFFVKKDPQRICHALVIYDATEQICHWVIQHKEDQRKKNLLKNEHILLSLGLLLAS